MFAVNMGALWSYKPYKWPYKCETGVISPYLWELWALCWLFLYWEDACQGTRQSARWQLRCLSSKGRVFHHGCIARRQHLAATKGWHVASMFSEFWISLGRTWEDFCGKDVFNYFHFCTNQVLVVFSTTSSTYTVMKSDTNLSQMATASRFLLFLMSIL